MEINDILRKATRKKLVASCYLGTAFLIMLGCSGDDSEDDISGIDCQAGTWTEWVENEFTNYYNALNAYGTDPSDINCAAVKTAALDYLEALREIADCVPTANKAAIDQAIDEAEVEVANETCD